MTIDIGVVCGNWVEPTGWPGLCNDYYDMLFSKMRPIVADVAWSPCVRVCVSVCVPVFLLVVSVCCAKAAGPISMPFGAALSITLK